MRARWSVMLLGVAVLSVAVGLPPVLAGPGQVVELEALPGAEPASQAWSVNSSGVIVGFNGPEAVRWIPVDGTWVVEPLGLQGLATGVNEGGQICIRSGGQAWIWEDGEAQLLTAPGPFANANGINNRGDVAGGALLSFQPFTVRAVVWPGRPGAAAQVLEPLPGGDFCDAFAIDDVGRVVGRSSRVPAGQTVPVVWLPTKDGYRIVELANEIPDDDPFLGGFARTISNSGLIGGVREGSLTGLWRVRGPNVSVTPLDVLATINSVNNGKEFVGFTGVNGGTGDETARPAYWAGPRSEVELPLPDKEGFFRGLSNRKKKQPAYGVGFFFVVAPDGDQYPQAFVLVIP